MLTRLIAVATCALSVTGCLTLGSRFALEPAPNPVRAALERENRAIFERAVKCDKWVPDFHSWNGSGREGSYFERDYHYQFRCVKNETEIGGEQSRVGWLLPSTEYPRVINATYREMMALIIREGGSITHQRATGSTFELDYIYGDVTGRLRGRIGPCKPNVGDHPDATGQYTSLEVDFREELVSKRSLTR